MAPDEATPDERGGAAAATAAASSPTRRSAIRVPVIVAGVLIVAGFAAVGLAWIHVRDTDQVWVQNQEIVSGGLGGLGLIVVGSMLLVRDAFLHGRAVVMREMGSDTDGELLERQPVTEGAQAQVPTRSGARSRPSSTSGRTAEAGVTDAAPGPPKRRRTVREGERG